MQCRENRDPFSVVLDSSYLRSLTYTALCMSGVRCFFNESGVIVPLRKRQLSPNVERERMNFNFMKM